VSEKGPESKGARSHVPGKKRGKIVEFTEAAKSFPATKSSDKVKKGGEKGAQDHRLLRGSQRELLGGRRAGPAGWGWPSKKFRQRDYLERGLSSRRGGPGRREERSADWSTTKRTVGEREMPSTVLSVWGGGKKKKITRHSRMEVGRTSRGRCVTKSRQEVVGGWSVLSTPCGVPGSRNRRLQKSQTERHIKMDAPGGKRALSRPKNFTTAPRNRAIPRKKASRVMSLYLKGGDNHRPGGREPVRQRGGNKAALAILAERNGESR